VIADALGAGLDLRGVEPGIPARLPQNKPFLRRE